MTECTANYFIHNNEIKESQRFDLDFISRQHCIYEVLRVIDGKPLFYVEHMKRFAKSASLEQMKFIPDEPTIRSIMKKLIDINQCYNGNIKLISYPDQDGKGSLIAYWNPHFYPTEEDYRTGLSVMFYQKTRNNPNSKRLNVDFRKEVSDFIRTNKLYEVILLDEEGYITEGGRSNVFFIRGNHVFTTPSGLVLPGITRDKVFSICTEQSIPISEVRIARIDAFNFDAMFVTSTSSKVLPIRQLSQITYNTTNALMRTIMDNYNIIMDENVRQFKWE